MDTKSIDWDNFATWPATDTMSAEGRCYATAALIREFSDLDVYVEPGTPGSLIVVCAGEFRMPSMPTDHALVFLEGFMEGCEIMAAKWRKTLKGTVLP